MFLYFIIVIAMSTTSCLSRPYRGTIPPRKLVKVFGVGLSKTGTTALGGALEELGYKNIHSDRGFAPFFPHLFEYEYDYRFVIFI